jgi:HD superfamily phosphodiesterase
MSKTIKDLAEGTSISGVMIPDSKLAREATELVRDTEPSLLFNHSTRVYYFAALAGKRRELRFDSELLYVAAMFHDMGLTPRYSSKSDRFEVDGANTCFCISGQLNEPSGSHIELHQTRFSGALERHVANCSRADPVPARMKVVGVSVFFDLLRLHDS